MNGSFPVNKWLAIIVPAGAFIAGILAFGDWKGDVSARLTAVEKTATDNEEIHRDEMWEVRKYFHSVDMNILLIATKMKIDKSELSSLELEMPKRTKR